jgi:uncharacterized YccA/Bax inhibitor family protein
MERSSNPALRDEIFYRSLLTGTEDLMTIQGTINKTLVLLCVVLVTAALVWNSYAVVFPIIIPAMIGGLIVALVTIFRQQYSPYTAPVYALFEGIILGGISGYMDALYPGIVVQAVALTFGVFFLLLIVFSTRLIRVTEKFRLVVIAATGAIVLLYLADIALGFFGRPVGFIHESGLFGIGFSLVVIVIASLNLILDFDYIEKGIEHGAPRYLEWYGAFALLVTLVWLYLEILRLLGKMRR